MDNDSDDWLKEVQYEVFTISESAYREYGKLYTQLQNRGTFESMRNQYEQDLVHPIGAWLCAQVVERVKGVGSYHESKEDSPKILGTPNRKPDGNLFRIAKNCLGAKDNQLSGPNVANTLVSFEWKTPSDEAMNGAVVQSVQDFLRICTLSGADLRRTSTFHLIGNGTVMKLLRLTPRPGGLKCCVVDKAVFGRPDECLSSEQMGKLVGVLVGLCTPVKEGNVAIKEGSMEGSIPIKEGTTNPILITMLKEGGNKGVCRYMQTDGRVVVGKKGLGGELELLRSLWEIEQLRHSIVEPCLSDTYVITVSFGDSLQILSCRDGFDGLFDVVLDGTCNALNALHTIARHSHNDIQPGNILVDSKHQVKLTDFGSSRKLETNISKDDKELLTRRGFSFLKIINLDSFKPACDFVSLFCVMKWMTNFDFHHNSSGDIQKKLFTRATLSTQVEWGKLSSTECAEVVRGFVKVEVRRSTRNK